MCTGVISKDYSNDIVVPCLNVLNRHTILKAETMLSFKGDICVSMSDMQCDAPCQIRMHALTKKPEKQCPKEWNSLTHTALLGWYKWMEGMDLSQVECL